MASSRAADFPSEVIDQIVSKFRPWQEGFFYRDIVGAQKSELGHLSLTCKHWARRCRPYLFSDTTISSTDEFLHFLSLVDSPVATQVKPPMLACLKTLHLLVVGPPWPQPWLHSAYTGTIKRRKALVAFYPDYIDDIRIRTFFGTYGPPEDSENIERERHGYAPLTWCTNLPRSLPSTAFSIQELDLSLLRFRTPTSLIRLVQSTHSIRRLICRGLQFDDWPEESYQLADQVGSGSSSLRELLVNTGKSGSVPQDADLLLFVARNQLRRGPFQSVLRHFTGWDALNQLVYSLFQPEVPADIELTVPSRQWTREGECCKLYWR